MIPNEPPIVIAARSENPKTVEKLLTSTIPIDQVRTALVEVAGKQHASIGNTDVFEALLKYLSDNAETERKRNIEETDSIIGDIAKASIFFHTQDKTLEAAKKELENAVKANEEKNIDSIITQFITTPNIPPENKEMILDLGAQLKKVINRTKAEEKENIDAINDSLKVAAAHLADPKIVDLLLGLHPPLSPTKEIIEEAFEDAFMAVPGIISGLAAENAGKVMTEAGIGEEEIEKIQAADALSTENDIRNQKSIINALLTKLNETIKRRFINTIYKIHGSTNANYNGKYVKLIKKLLNHHTIDHEKAIAASVVSDVLYIFSRPPIKPAFVEAILETRPEDINALERSKILTLVIFGKDTFPQSKQTITMLLNHDGINHNIIRDYFKGLAKDPEVKKDTSHYLNVIEGLLSNKKFPEPGNKEDIEAIKATIVQVKSLPNSSNYQDTLKLLEEKLTFAETPQLKQMHQLYK